MKQLSSSFYMSDKKPCAKLISLHWSKVENIIIQVDFQQEFTT